ncbi:unnamed protein product [Lasius platythorax]|uniref:Myb-like domain-containing protein n=1 Tax=Lasius platythorax TaxID=488582 RepID=A0AAV2N031_9HYME
MSLIFKKFILSENKQIIEEGTGTRVLCEVENEAGDLNIIMMNKGDLLEAGYEIPDNHLYEKETEESPSFNENAELDASTKNSVDEWSNESTRLLLDKYADYLELVGPMKQFKNKKLMWMEIAKDLETVVGIKKTYIQCENRYKTILRRKRISDNNNSTSGSKRVKVSFENEIKRIAAKDDSVEPEVLQSANNVVVNVKNTNLSKAPNTIRKKKAKSILETLVEIHNEKETKKQERHEEKMRLLKGFLEKENVHKDS